MWKHAHECVTRLSYSEINEDPIDAFSELTPQVREFIDDINHMRHKYIDARIQMFSELAFRATQTIHVTLPPTISGSELATVFINHIQPWYESNGLKPEFEIFPKLQYILRGDRQCSSILWFWCAVLAHLHIVARCVKPYFDSFIKETEFSLDVIAPTTLLLLREANFACSLFVGDKYTEFCHAILFANHLFSPTQSTIVFLVKTYLLILETEFDGICPHNWRHPLVALQ